MQIFEVSFIRRLSDKTTSTSMWLSKENHNEFIAAMEQALTLLRPGILRIFDLFDNSRYISLGIWEQITISELKGQRHHDALNVLTNWHKTVSPDGKIIDISRRADAP